MTESQFYKSRTALHTNGTLVIKAKVRLNGGVETLEVGKSSGIDVKSGLTFLLSNAITQIKFGHFKKVKGDWKKYYSASDVVLEDEYSINIYDSYFLYNKANGLFRYKRIKVKNKYYVQSYKQNQKGKYTFNERFKYSPQSKKKINKVKSDLDL